MTVIIFLIVLAVLIFVHEFGHFVSARAFGIRVDAFKIGFGPRLVSWKRGETEYGINAIPFGGYVKIFGENPDAESVNGPDASKSFVNKARWKQTIVLASGVICNFIFAWFLFSVIFMSGITASTDSFNSYTDRFKDPRIIVTSVAPNSPAERVGLKQGDVILYVETTAMNAKRLPRSPSQSITDIQNIINDFGDKPVAVDFLRENNRTIIGVTPVAGIVKDKFAIGISMERVANLQLPFFSAIIEGFRYTLNMIKETVIALYTFIANIFVGQPNFADVAGPIGIAKIVGDATRMGFTYLLLITAIISINLGVVNLIPFPALDGGRILFVLIESVFRRRIPSKVANMFNLVGFALLMILMVAVTWKDLARLWS